MCVCVCVCVHVCVCVGGGECECVYVYIYDCTSLHYRTHCLLPETQRLIYILFPVIVKGKPVTEKR